MEYREKKTQNIGKSVKKNSSMLCQFPGKSAKAHANKKAQAYEIHTTEDKTFVCRVEDDNRLELKNLTSWREWTRMDKSDPKLEL